MATFNHMVYHRAMPETMQACQTYTTLDGRVLDLSSLSEVERAYFARCLTAYRAGVPWAELCRLIETPENPLLVATDGWITRAVWDHPLFRAVRDLSDRLGLQQGKIGPEPGDDPRRDPLADEWIPAAEAARRKGVTLPGLHKAIKRGRVLATLAPVGGVRWFVSANSLDQWRPNPVRQAARRQGRALVKQ